MMGKRYHLSFPEISPVEAGDVQHMYRTRIPQRRKEHGVPCNDTYGHLLRFGKRESLLEDRVD